MSGTSSITLPDVSVTAPAPSNFAYQGAQNANTTVNGFNADDFHIQQSLAAVRTALPVKVMRAPYDASGNAIPPGTVGPVGFIDVQPLVNQWDGNNSATPHGTIYKISYFRYQSALGAVIADPAVGDIGEIIVHDRDTSVVRATGAQGNPGSRRKHDLADGVYHGQMIAGTPRQYVAFTGSGISISDENGNSIVMNSSGITITSLNGSGPITVKGNTRTNVLNTHEHAGVQTGGGISGPPLSGT